MLICDKCNRKAEHVIDRIAIHTLKLEYRFFEDGIDLCESCIGELRNIIQEFLLKSKQASEASHDDM